MIARTFDRVRSFGGGIDAYRPPSELGPDQGQLGENLMIGDNYAAGTRPGADQLDKTFAPAPAGFCQGLFYFDTAANKFLLMGQGNKLYTWNGAAWSGALAFGLTANATFVAAQGVDKALLSDGVQQCQIWDGVNFTPAGNTVKDAPVGATILLWAGGRMFAAGVAAFPDTIWVSNRLAYSAGNWDTATRSFRIGSGDGDPIVALALMPGFIMVVVKRNSVWLVNVDPSNEPANFSAQDLGDILTDGLGGVGRFAGAKFQNDYLFMTQEGVHSVQRMQAAAGQYQLTAPLSLPLQPYIDRINWDYKHTIVAKKFRHLVFFFVPLDVAQTPSHALVWNGRLGQWAGIFTGWPATQAEVTRFSGNIRFVFGDSAGLINQWKEFASSTADATYLDNGLAITTRYWTRAFTFGNPDLEKKLRAMLLRFNSGNANVTVTVSPDLFDADMAQSSVQPSGDFLPAVLPMLLASFKPVMLYKGLAGLPYCNEVFLKVETVAPPPPNNQVPQWWQLRNATMTCDLKPMKTNA